MSNKVGTHESGRDREWEKASNTFPRVFNPAVLQLYGSDFKNGFVGTKPQVFSCTYIVCTGVPVRAVVYNKYQ